METLSINNHQDSTVIESKEEYWQKQIAQWQISGLAQPEFCKRNELSYTTFGYWRSRLSRANKKSQPNNILPVSIQPKPTSNPQNIRLRLSNGTLIEIPTSVGAQTLKQIFQCLALTK